MLIDHHDQQIVRRKTQNLELCFGTNVGTNQAKIEKISISRAIRLEFLRSLVSAIRYEANKINRRREERPIGSRAVKMLRDLQWRACCLEHHVATANERAEVRARMHNILSIDILAQNAASRSRFFQIQAIKTGHILIIYRQTSDILSVSSKGTADAK